MRNHLKDSVLDSVDIVDLIGEHVSLKRRGKEFVGLCPFHPDKTPSLNVNPSKRIFKCFACGAGGDVIRFVQLRERVEFSEAVRILAQRAGLEQRFDRPSEHVGVDDRQPLLDVMKWASGVFQSNLASGAGTVAREYALRRGLNEQTLSTHAIGFAADSWDQLLGRAERAGVPFEHLQNAGLCGVSEKGKRFDRFRNRLMFPICDGSGRPIALGGRTLADDPAKYLNSPETPLFGKSRVLYGLHLARRAIEEKRQAIVVEGYLDAALLYQFGIQNVVATLGTALSDAHVKLLKRQCDELVLCFDGDDAGNRAADRGLELALQHQVEVRVLVLPDGLDPADCLITRGAETFLQLLQSAVPALEFRWLRLKAEYGGSDEPRLRRAAAAEFLQFISRTASARGMNPVEQGLLVSKLSEMLSIPAHSVYASLALMRRTKPRRETDGTDDVPLESRYASSVRGVPPALVCAAEAALGWIVLDSACFSASDEVLYAAFSMCEVWKRMYARMLELRERLGDFVRVDVVGLCDDAESMELISRALARVDEQAAAREAFAEVRARLRSELDALRMSEMQRELNLADPQASGSDEAFRKYMAMARGQCSAVAVERRSAAV